MSEKQKIYDEYKQIVGSNLQKFMTKILKVDASGLVALMSLYNGDYNCLEYVLAVEDYAIFHNFMYESNLDMDQQVQLKQMKLEQKQQRQEQKRLLAEIVEVNNEEDWRPQTSGGSKLTEEQCIQEAIRLSKLETDQ